MNILYRYTATDKQQNVDMQSVKASSSDAINSTIQAPPASPTAARLSAARRRDLKPSLMSHISGVHRLSGGVDGVAGEPPNGKEPSTTQQLPKYGVDCADIKLLDEVYYKNVIVILKSNNNK